MVKREEKYLGSGAKKLIEPLFKKAEQLLIWESYRIAPSYGTLDDSELIDIFPSSLVESLETNFK